MTRSSRSSHRTDRAPALASCRRCHTATRRRRDTAAARFSNDVCSPCGQQFMPCRHTVRCAADDAVPCRHPFLPMTHLCASPHVLYSPRAPCHAASHGVASPCRCVSQPTATPSRVRHRRPAQPRRALPSVHETPQRPAIASRNRLSCSTRALSRLSPCRAPAIDVESLVKRPRSQPPPRLAPSERLPDLSCHREVTHASPTIGDAENDDRAMVLPFFPCIRSDKTIFA